LLAAFGDDRPGVGLDADSLPDIVWCDVPEGECIIGEDSKTLRVRIPAAFQISRYLITNAQYQAFVADGGTPARKFREPFGLSNHPVVGVSWDDAIAFCDWFTAQLWKKGALHKGEEVRLPSEVEWEYAARGPDEHIYPWGNHSPKPELANYHNTNLGATSAVGAFPRGRSSYDCEDMAGNVWEWCQDSWYNDYQDAPNDGSPRVNKDDKNSRVLRGGSWTFDAHDCRCAVRCWYNPGRRYEFLGFRVVLSACASFPTNEWAG